MMDEEIWLAINQERVANILTAVSLDNDIFKASLFCCPNCLRVIRMRKFLARKCKDCGQSYSGEELEFLSQLAIDSALYGWTYGRYYEEQKKKEGKIRERPFFPPPTESFIILAGIVIAAIIGGLSYDGFKKLIQVCVKKNKDDKLRKELENMNDEELKSFYQYVKEYYSARKKKETTKKSLKSESKNGKTADPSL